MTVKKGTTEKMTDRSFTLRITMAIVAILACMISLTVTTYALFTVDITTAVDSRIEAYSFALEAAMDDGTAVRTTYEEKARFSLESGAHTLALSNSGTRAGFAVVTVSVEGNPEEIYYAALDPEETRLIQLNALRDGVVTVYAHWGNYESYAKMNDNPGGYEYNEVPRPNRGSEFVLTFGQPENKTFAVAHTSSEPLVVGNENEITLGDLFRLRAEAEAFTELAVRFVKENESDSVAGPSFDRALTNETWADEKISFAGTGVVKVLIAEPGAEVACEALVAVTEATNVWTYEELKAAVEEEEPADIVVLSDLEMDEDGEEGEQIAFSGIKVYGNGYTFDVTRGRYFTASEKTADLTGNEAPSENHVSDEAQAETKSEGNEAGTGETVSEEGSAEAKSEENESQDEKPTEYLIWIDDAELIGWKIIGKTCGEAEEAFDYPVLTATGASSISDSLIQGGVAPILLAGGELKLTGTTLKGGIRANLLWIDGDLVLEDVSTENRYVEPEEGEKAESFGLGILALNGTDSTEHRTLTVRGELTFENEIREDQVEYCTDSEALKVLETLFSDATRDAKLGRMESVEDEETEELTEYHWMNTGIVSLTENFAAEDIVFEDENGEIIETPEGYESYIGALKGTEEIGLFLFAPKTAE